MSSNTVSAIKMTPAQPVEQPKPSQTVPTYKSWAVMAYEAYEEDLLEREEENRKKYRKIIEERKYLLSIGEYDLEDGEILD
jgi:hypothetical protein